MVDAGVMYRVAVKRVGTARRFTLRVRAATRDAVLTMPLRASLRTAQAFAERHAEWIGARLRGLPGPIIIAPGTILPLRGVDHLIVHRLTAPRATRLVVLCPPERARDLLRVLQVSCGADEIGAAAPRVPAAGSASRP